jgi:endo-1,4-beta-xylanase
LVEFCAANDIFLTGHTLVWHQQTPDWVFEDRDGNPASRELLLERLEEHINTVIGHFKGAVPSWDVVNEALNEDGSMRPTKWQQIIGDDFVEKAFEFAHKADPRAKLYYNDYNLYKPEKRAGVLRLVKSLQDKGIPVHGIGMQGHYGLTHPADLTQIEDSILAFSGLGDVMITELDMTVLPSPDKADEGADISIDLELKARYNPYTGGLPVGVQATQDQRFLDIFGIFLKHQDRISRVTFWGVNDAQSWRNDWPMRGRTDYPLLVDRNNTLKPVVYKLFDLTDSYPVAED